MANALYDLAAALKRNSLLSKMDPRDTANALATAQSEAVAGIGSNMLPGVGDLVGLAQDANMYWSDPASRRARNYLLTGLGALPFLPALASLGKTTRNVPTSFGNEAGMVAYHGSPHDFDAFDMSKIGTGEGAQAYGHGLYVAENKGVAGSYARTLGDINITAKEGLLNDVAKELRLNARNNVFPATSGYIPEAEAIAKTRKTFEVRLAEAERKGRAADAYNIRSALNQLDRVADSIKFDAGYVYTVDLPDEQIAKMLDWDAPLSEQPEAVRKALETPELSGWLAKPTARGRDFASVLEMKKGEAGASEYLRSLGIPGIKYFDGGSRTAGQGTRNFVVFDDKLLKILSKE